MNRTIHRWVSLPIAIIMLVVAVSGIWLQVYEFGGEHGPPGDGHRGAPAVAEGGASDAELGAMVASALAAGREENADFRPDNISVTLGRGAPQVTLNGPGGRQAAKITFDPATGEASYSPPPPMSIRGVIIGLHTGRLGGVLGLVLVMASGIILTVLSVTGLVVYIDMWRRRRKAGKKGLFW